MTNKQKQVSTHLSADGFDAIVIGVHHRNEIHETLAEANFLAMLTKKTQDANVAAAFRHLARECRILDRWNEIQDMVDRLLYDYIRDEYAAYFHESL